MGVLGHAGRFECEEEEGAPSLSATRRRFGGGKRHRMRRTVAYLRW
jgi:hypothetical protein